MATPTLTPRQQAVERALWAVQQNPIYLDTETTGLERSDEIVEISILDDCGEVLFHSMVRPSQKIPPQASAIHGISNEEVQAAQPWPILWPQIRPILAGRTIVAYNSDFDHRMLQQSHARYRM